MITSGLMGNLEGVNRLQKGFAELKMGIIGVGTAVAGLAGIKGIVALTEHASKLSHELVQIQKLGINPTDFEKYKAAAYGAHNRVPGVTSVDALQVLGMTHSMFGVENSIKVLDPLLKFAQVMGAQSGNYQKAMEDLKEAVRAGDLMGKFLDETTHKVDVDKLKHFLDLGVKVGTATHGMVESHTWLMMAQQGGPSLSTLSDEGLVGMAMIAQMMKGPRAGTALTSLAQQMVGGKMMQYQAQELAKLGIGSSDFTVGKGGHLIWGEGALNTPFAEALKKDPIEASQIMMKALVSHGFDTMDKIVPELYQILGRQTTQRIVHDMLRNAPQMFDERGRIMKGMGLDAAYKVQTAQDYEQVKHNLLAAENEMLMHIGITLAPSAIFVMKSITALFDAIADFSKAHPDLVAFLGKSFFVLSAGLVALGTVLLGSAIVGAVGTGGWLIAGIAGLGAAAGAAWLAFNHDWSATTAAIEKFRAANWNEAITNALSPAGNAILKWASGLGAWFTSSFADAAALKWADLGDWFTKTFAGTFESMKTNLTGLIPDLFDAITKMLKDGLETVKGAFKDFVDWIKSWIPSWRNISGRAGDIPGMAEHLGLGSSAGALSAGERGQYADIIKKVAAQEGVDPKALLKIYGTEGASAWYGDSGKSFGPFQLYTGGGLGNLYHGSRERSARGVEEQTRYVARYGKVHGGWSSDIWHGLRGHGGSIPYRASESSVPPARGTQLALHSTVHLDGRIISASVEKHMVHRHQFAHGTSDHDGRAGMPLVDYGSIA